MDGNDVRSAIGGDDVAERNISALVYRSQPDDGSWKVMPETHALSR